MGVWVRVPAADSAEILKSSNHDSEEEEISSNRHSGIDTRVSTVSLVSSVTHGSCPYTLRDLLARLLSYLLLAPRPPRGRPRRRRPPHTHTTAAAAGLIFRILGPRAATALI